MFARCGWFQCGKFNNNPSPLSPDTDGIDMCKHSTIGGLWHWVYPLLHPIVFYYLNRVGLSELEMSLKGFFQETLEILVARILKAIRWNLIKTLSLLGHHRTPIESTYNSSIIPIIPHIFPQVPTGSAFGSIVCSRTFAWGKATSAECDQGWSPPRGFGRYW